MRKSVLIALGVFIAAALWMWPALTGANKKSVDNGTIAEKNAQEKSAKRAMRVEVMRLEPQEMAVRIEVNGQTHPSRSVELRARTDGRIATVHARRGDRLEAGQLIAEMEPDDRPAVIARARAQLRQHQREYEVAQGLRKQGHGSQVALETAQAQLESARAELVQAELDLAHTKITAPFDGILEESHIEEGATIRTGDTAALFVDLDPVEVRTFVPERHIGHIRVGGRAEILLSSGEEAEGTVHYISSNANRETRTFRVDIRVENGGHLIAGGMTAKAFFILPSRDAFFLPLSTLTLDDQGIVGVKTVLRDSEDAPPFAKFFPVRILEERPYGVWVDGLEPGVDLITLGHEFVADRQQVIPVPVQSAAGSTDEKEGEAQP